MSAPNSVHCFINGALPLELEMRVEEEEEDDPDEVESRPYSGAYDDTQEDEEEEDEEEEHLPIPVEVTITPSVEEFHVKQEEEDSSATLDATTVHEEVDIKEEEAYKDEEEIERPLAVNIKEERIEEEEEEEQVMVEPSLPVYETSSDAERDAPKVKTVPPVATVLVEEGHNSEEEILPHAAMVVVPGGPVEYPEGFVEENVALKPSIRTVKRQKLSSKRVDTVYRCPNCSLCYTSPEYLAGHVRRGCRYRPTPIKNAYLCIICGEGFNNYGDLYQHKRQKHDQTAAGESVSATRKYPSAVEAPRTFKCPNCPRAFTASRYLLQHQRSHLRQQTDHSCDLCGEDFKHKSRSLIEEHFAKSHPTKQAHRCNHCERVYGYRQSLVTHLQTHNEFKCFVCNKQFSSRVLLSAHFRTHANQPFECNICRKSYLQQGRFYEHRRREHGIIEKPIADPGDQWKDLGYADDADEEVDDDVQVISVVDASSKSGRGSEESGERCEDTKTEISSLGS